MTRQCQNCKKEFAIEPEDFKFYEKINVPPPTWCPECRLMRRLSMRNQMTLYRRADDVTSEEVISIYSKDKPFKVYSQTYWHSDKWNPLNYGRDYDFNKPFVEQFRELLLSVPRQSLLNINNIRSEYVNYAANNKECYLVFSAEKNENMLYGFRVFYNKDCVDSFELNNSELCYECIQSSQCYKCAFSIKCEQCTECVLCYDCRNCQNCFCSVGLRNKQYYIFNAPYTKEEYLKRIEEFKIGAYSKLMNLKEKASASNVLFPRKFANVVKSENCIGDNISNSKNCFHVFDVKESKDIKYLLFGFKAFNSMDVSYNDFGEWIYETMSCENDARKFFTTQCWHCNDIQYSDTCLSSSNLFGCVGLKNKSYCILNKQYTKEEYERMVPKIIEHMNSVPYIDKKGRIYKYGEFFPPELSPFSYNETIAQEYFPLTKKEALEKGYSWKDPEPRNYQVTMTTEQIPDHIKDVHDPILNDIIQCAHWPLGGLTAKCNEQCTQAFRIIPQELAFLKRMNLPLPRLCPNCRHYQRIKQRNPLKLWHRKCNCHGEYGISDLGRLDNYKNTADHIHHKKDEPCPNEFETTYAPERPEIVYCEQCYLREVV